MVEHFRTHVKHKVEVDTNLPPLKEGNSDNLETLCRNIIDNAIRYTPNYGEISVQLQHKSNTIELKDVANPDTGLSIVIAIPINTVNG